MPVYSFKNDYSEGAHPRILEALMSSNFEQTEGYGMDAKKRQKSGLENRGREKRRQSCASFRAAAVGRGEEAGGDSLRRIQSL